MLRQVVRLLEHLGPHVPLEDDALDDAGAVAQNNEPDLARRPLVVDPAGKSYFFADRSADSLNHCFHERILGRESGKSSTGGALCGCRRPGSTGYGPVPRLVDHGPAGCGHLPAACVG